MEATPRGGRQPGVVLRQYYAELTSSPHLPVRTSSTLLSQKPKGPEAYRNINQPELGLVNYKLNSDWEFQVAPKVQACLDEMQVQWTSLDIVLIGKVGASSTIERLPSLSTANTPVARPLGASMVSKTLVSLTFTTTHDSRISSWTPCRNSRVVGHPVGWTSAPPASGCPLLRPNCRSSPPSHSLGLHITPLATLSSRQTRCRTTSSNAGKQASVIPTSSSSATRSRLWMYLLCKYSARSWEFTKKMRPNPESGTSFKFPSNHLLKVWGTISDSEMRCPMLDANGNPCIRRVGGLAILYYEQSL